jgi:GDP-L-fucose synthase
MKVLIHGGTGMLGSAFTRFYRSKDGIECISLGKEDVDLLNQSEIYDFISDFMPDVVINCAGVIGGIKFNSEYPSKIIYENSLIQLNVAKVCETLGVKCLVGFASSVVYPELTSQPMKESQIGSGDVNSLIKPFALSKLLSIEYLKSLHDKMEKRYFTVIASNLYGPGDSLDLDRSHVLPAMIGKILKAKLDSQDEVVLLGDGTPVREFLHVDDLVKAVNRLIPEYESKEPINIGSGFEISMRGLAELIALKVDYKGKLVWDTYSPNGNDRRFLDSSRIREYGWSPTKDFEVSLGELIDERV